jgi:hypothetical protein
MVRRSIAIGNRADLGLFDFHVNQSGPCGYGRHVEMVLMDGEIWSGTPARGKWTEAIRRDADAAIRSLWTRAHAG